MSGTESIPGDGTVRIPARGGWQCPMRAGQGGRRGRQVVDVCLLYNWLYNWRYQRRYKRSLATGRSPWRCGMRALVPLLPRGPAGGFLGRNRGARRRERPAEAASGASFEDRLPANRLRANLHRPTARQEYRDRTRPARDARIARRRRRTLVARLSRLPQRAAPAPPPHDASAGRPRHPSRPGNVLAAADRQRGHHPARPRQSTARGAADGDQDAALHGEGRAGAASSRRRGRPAHQGRAHRRRPRGAAANAGGRRRLRERHRRRAAGGRPSRAGAAARGARREHRARVRRARGRRPATKRERRPRAASPATGRP